MLSLFGDHETAVPGLSYRPDYIDRSCEAGLISHIDSNDWICDLRRRVQHYGYRYDYTSRQVLPAHSLGSMPGWLSTWCERLHAEGHFADVPDQVIVNEYLPGQGIAPHVDRIHCFGDPIVILSLGSACVMDFIHVATRKKAPRVLAPRSLAVMSGESRYRWEHGIRPRKSDLVEGARIPRGRRLSITFRKVVLA